MNPPESHPVVRDSTPPTLAAAITPYSPTQTSPPAQCPSSTTTPSAHVPATAATAHISRRLPPPVNMDAVRSAVRSLAGLVESSAARSTGRVTAFSISDRSSSPTTEGHLKSRLDVLFPSRRSATIVGIYGLGGMGKTVAMISIGWEPDVRERFPDGVHYMTIGINADEAHVIHQIAHVVLLSGGNSLSSQIELVTSAMTAAKVAEKWFANRKILFLCDGIYPSAQSPDGFLSVLKVLTRSANESGLIFATQDRTIAEQGASDPVAFTPRDPFGVHSREILIKQANRAADMGFDQLSLGEHSAALAYFLERAAGVPLTNAVVGSALADIRANSSSWEEALQTFEQRLATRPYMLFEETIDGYEHNLDAVIRVSFDVADKLRELGNGMDRSVQNSPSCLVFFARLCLFERKAIIPKYVLRKLWYDLNVDEVRKMLQIFLRLNLLVKDSSGKDGTQYTAYDHLLEFCEQEARTTNTFFSTHETFLNSFLPPRDGRPSNAEATNTSEMNPSKFISKLDLGVEKHRKILERSTRDWWRIGSLEQSRYLMNNLIRLLGRCNRLTEMIGVVSHAAWTRMRLLSVGESALVSDLKTCIATLNDISGVGQIRALSTSIKQIVLLLNIRGKRIIEDPTLLASEVHEGLHRCSDPCGILNRYMETCREVTSRA